MWKLKKLILLICLVSLFSIVILLNFSSDEITLKHLNEKKTLRIGILTFPKNLNPVYVTDETSNILVNKVYDSLYFFDSNGIPMSRIIKNVKILEDNESFAIDLVLKKDIFFSDGKKLNADDIISTIDIIKNRKYISPYRTYVNVIKKIEKKGNFKLKIIFLKKNANWKNYLTFKILNSNEIKSISLENFKQKLLSGSGPLKYEEVKKPSKIILSPNKFYNKIHHHKVLYSRVIYSVVLYSHNSPLKLMNNEVDIVDMPPECVLAYKTNPKWKQCFTLLKYKKFGYTYLAFNLNVPKLSKNVRHIIYNLLHRSFLNRFIINNGEIIKSPFLLLNEQAYANVFKTTAIKKKISIAILANTKSRVKKEFILFLSKELKAHNIELVPLFLEQQLMLAKIRNKEFEMVLSGFVLDIDYDMRDILYSNSYFNYSGYKSKKMDRLLDMGLNEFDKNRRKNIYIKAHNIWVEDLPLIPLYNLYFYMGVSKEIKMPKNLTSMMGSSGDFLQNIDEWIYN